MTLPLKRYKKDFEHSYTFGVFPTLELRDPDTLADLQRAHETSERWQLETAWAMLQGRQPPPYPEVNP